MINIKSARLAYLYSDAHVLNQARETRSLVSNLKMGEAARIYAEQLHRFGYGHALWWSHYAHAHSFFNVVRPANHERNGRGIALFLRFDFATYSNDPN